jgi:hypothetical protein
MPVEEEVNQSLGANRMSVRFKSGALRAVHDLLRDAFGEPATALDGMTIGH